MLDHRYGFECKDLILSNFRKLSFSPNGEKEALIDWRFSVPLAG